MGRLHYHDGTADALSWHGEGATANSGPPMLASACHLSRVSDLSLWSAESAPSSEDMLGGEDLLSDRQVDRRRLDGVPVLCPCLR